MYQPISRETPVAISTPGHVDSATASGQPEAGFSDEEREREIEAARQAMCNEPDSDGKRYWFDVMRELINGRSDARIAEMERDRGLR